MMHIIFEHADVLRSHTDEPGLAFVPVHVAKLSFPVQDAVGNYYDCRLTLQPAVVSNSLVSSPFLVQQ